jgi:uncharacterized coiled-coil protein SlyX
MKTTKLFALVLALFLLALPLTSCNLGADENLTARLDSMEALISQQNATIEGLNAKLGEQSSTIAGQNTIINGLNTQLFEQNTTIGTLNNQISMQNETISDLEMQVNVLAKEPSQKRIALTKENYADYIAFNVTFDDFDFCKMEEPFLGYEFLYRCSMTITTYAKSPNVQFDSVVLEYKTSSDTLPNNYTGGIKWTTKAKTICDQITDLAYSGYSQSTFTLMHISETETDFYLNTDQTLINIANITGYVIITE